MSGRMGALWWPRTLWQELYEEIGNAIIIAAACC
jgi:hypothetical protein